MEEGESNRSEDKLLGTPRESDDDDPMDGSLAELSSSEEYASDEHGPDLSEGEESDHSDFGDPFEGILHSRRKERAVLIICTSAATPQASMAKRRKLEKASPSKLKKSGLSRRVRGRLQNMMSLPLDVLFVVSSRHPKLLSSRLLSSISP